jgi:hypothetical protein
MTGFMFCIRHTSMRSSMPIMMESPSRLSGLSQTLLLVSISDRLTTLQMGSKWEWMDGFM